MDIVLSHIYKSFENPVFADLSCTFKSGTLTALCGSSGSGKTTLVNIILGFEKPDKGDLVFEKKPVFSVVFQEDRLMEELSARENILLNGCNKDECDRLLKLFGLDESKDRVVSKLSGGMKRRVAIIRALTYNADIYIFDEPFKGIDSEMKEIVMASVRKMLCGKTGILITHDLNETKIADIVLDLDKIKKGV